MSFTRDSGLTTEKMCSCQMFYQPQPSAQICSRDIGHAKLLSTTNFGHEQREGHDLFLVRVCSANLVLGLSCWSRLPSLWKCSL